VIWLFLAVVLVLVVPHPGFRRVVGWRISEVKCWRDDASVRVRIARVRSRGCANYRWRASLRRMARAAISNT
jgi:hypothetical protein